MGIIDSFRKSREQKKEHTTPPPQGHVLAEILQDKNKSHLFGELLRRDGNEDLAVRLAEGKLEESDINLLEQQRLVFSEKITQSEKIEKLLTKENVIDFARNHPEFEKIINLIGPEKAIRVIQSQLKEISITDENRFSNIASSMEAHESYKNGEYKETNDRVEKMCKDGKFTPQEYLSALAIEDPREKEKALKQLVSRTRGKFKKIISLISVEGSMSKEWANRTSIENLKGSEISLENSLADLDSHHQNIGSALFLSVSGNDQMRNSLFGELLNEKAPEEPKTGFKDAKKEASSNTFNEGEFDTAWGDFKNRMDYGGSNDSEKDWLKDKFIDDQKQAYKEKNKQGTGFWASIFATLFEGKINNKKATLK